MIARDIMDSKFLVTAKPSETVADAARKMREYNVGSVLIVDEQGKLLGIFTERDLVKVVASNKPLSTKLEEVMTKGNLVTASPDDPLPLIAHKMVEHNVRHIPVVDDQGRVVGIISIRKLLKYILSSHEWP
ncbi:MAG TPA: CBS domain-containing protein [Pyrodictium sp.]|nr:CBS domain-containing protein [Pyrodictium sp.]